MGALFMLRVLRDIPVMFQRFPLTCGSSTRHGRDMGHQIAKLAGFPAAAANARKMIEVTIAIYRSRKEKRRVALTPCQIHDELRAIGQDAQRLWQRLLRFGDRLPPDMSAEEFPGMVPEDLLAGLFDLSAHCAISQSDVGPAASGPHAADVRILVANLAAIREEFTGRPLTRSRKGNDLSRHYIELVCAIADPDIGGGAIDKAMRRAIARRKTRPPASPAAPFSATDAPAVFTAFLRAMFPGGG
jgi:hypothetical protein